METVSKRSVKQTLSELVQIDSISSRSNQEIISYLSNAIEQYGLNIKQFSYRDDNGIEKINLLALAPGFDFNETIELLLVGHTDTVPYDPSWTEATILTERNGRLYGRGACDTKGFIAASLVALQDIDFEKLKSPFALLFTADEEIGCIGAKHLADKEAFRARYSIVGEPTSLRPMRAGKGYCLADLILKGIEGHSAYPDLGASAIFRAARLIKEIERISEDLRADHFLHTAFDPPYTTINVGLIHGGTAKNILAGECRFTLEWRPVPGHRADYVIDLIREKVKELKSVDAGYNCEISIIRLDEGMETPADSPLVQMLEDATGKSAGTVAFGTEAPQMATLGAHAVILGPGDIRVAHRTDEFVPIVELESCVSILSNAIKHFCY
jgi:acetylornithine deacetylase